MDVNFTIAFMVNEIFQLQNPKIDVQRKDVLSDFIASAVNGDIPVDHLAINAKVDEKNDGCILYILTNLRLIKIDISSKETKSSSFPLNTLIGVDRKLLDDQIEFSVSFQNGAFGLRYLQELKNITNFFQKIEPLRKI